VLFTATNDEESFQPLSMLAIDRETRGIPVITYAMSRDVDMNDGVFDDIRYHLSNPVPDPLH
jgi:hypothetical protein